MYSRHGPWVTNTMARNKNKQNPASVSGQDLKNIKGQLQGKSEKLKGKRPQKLGGAEVWDQDLRGPDFRSMRRTDGFARDLADYAKQLVLPIDVVHPKVSPSNYPVQVCSRHIHKVVDVSSATPAYANGFTVTMNPNLYAPGFILTPAATAAPHVAGLLSVHGDIDNNVKSVVGDIIPTAITAVDTEEVTSHIKLKKIPDVAALELVGLQLTPGIHSMRMSLHVKAGAPIHWETWFKTAGGAWTNNANLSTHIGVQEDADLNWTSGANVDAIAFRMTATTVATEVKLSIVFVQSQVIGNVGETFSPAFQKFVIDNDVTHGRVVSMSILATNTSPDLADGGNINAGRVPKNFNPFTDIASQMAALPTNRRYQGRAKDGAFVTWMPSQFDEFEIDTITNKHEQLKDAEYLIVEVAGWNPPGGATASFRLQFDWIIEFYTPNQLFEKQITPPSTPSFQSLYHMVLCMDAATCNPGHLDQLKKLVGYGVEGLTKGAKFYNEHEEIINKVLSLLGSLLM